VSAIKEYFELDRMPKSAIGSSNNLRTATGLDVPFRMHQDFTANVIYVSLFLREVENPLDTCRGLLLSGGLAKMLTAAPALTFEAQNPKMPPMRSSDLVFAGRAIVYSENILSEAEVETLEAECRGKGILVQYFGPRWAEQMSALEKPQAFISHDTRDKEVIARPLALELLRLSVPVWFDDFSLKVGDSLREKIEKGLLECRKCILVVTQNFLSNTGWTKTEFNAIFTREILERENLVLPIWAGVSAREVLDFSPTLADRRAINWTAGVERAAGEIAAVLRAPA
jgi:hypothetical protein